TNPIFTLRDTRGTPTGPRSAFQDGCPPEGREDPGRSPRQARFGVRGLLGMVRSLDEGGGVGRLSFVPAPCEERKDRFPASRGGPRRAIPYADSAPRPDSPPAARRPHTIVPRPSFPLRPSAGDFHAHLHAGRPAARHHNAPRQGCV